jgi:hypothetical protein
MVIFRSTAAPRKHTIAINNASGTALKASVHDTIACSFGTTECSTALTRNLSDDNLYVRRLYFS